MRSDPASRKPRPTAPARQVDGNDLVVLNPDHPGFSDADYRTRRNAIAQLALGYRDTEPVPTIEYTEIEHGVWRTVWENLEPLHARYACRPYLDGVSALRLHRTRIPQLAEVNAQIEPATGFRMLPVAGLVSSRRFLGELARGVFLSTQYIRHHSVPLYTPEPDIVHELVGHAAILAHPAFAMLNRRFGVLSKGLNEEDLGRLERLYWYTLEFGAVKEEGQLKVCGAGLLSSYGELSQFEQEAELRPLDIEEVLDLPYDPTAYQKVIYVAPSLEALSRMLLDFLETLAPKP